MGGESQIEMILQSIKVFVQAIIPGTSTVCNIIHFNVTIGFQGCINGTKTSMLNKAVRK